MLSTRFTWSVVLLIAAVSPAPAEDLSGEQIYKKHCAWCHGADGGGGKRYKMPLAGEKSAADLAKQITGTMPDDDPSKINSDDAKKVAVYIYEAFYSPAAQARSKPPRVELARLTVGQYRNAVADVVGSFRRSAKWDEQRRGLQGEYFAARGFQNNKLLIDRLDPQVMFDFGTEGPGEKFEANEFTIRWSGSVLAPETGDYDFIVKRGPALGERRDQTADRRLGQVR
jgi:cytochrome c553